MREKTDREINISSTIHLTHLGKLLLTYGLCFRKHYHTFYGPTEKEHAVHVYA
jgi:hypothetical protein